MFKLNQFIAIFALILAFFVVIQMIGRVQHVNALADCVCSDWECWFNEPAENPKPNDPYPNGSYQCACDEEQYYGDSSSTTCTSGKCPPGTYVCNRDEGCCDYGTVYPDDNDSSGENTCGNGVCDSKENCMNCGSDCGVCCGDGDCNYEETCLTCELDCGICPEGDFCGDGICSIDEECDLCYVDCGACPYCGDYTCAGFETCANCEEDCGVCTDNFAWWQVWGGHFAAANDFGYVIRSLIPNISICIEPSCFPYLSVTDRDRSDKSDGFPFLGGGEVLANDQISDREEQVYVTNTSTSRLRETYSYFYSRYSLGFSPEDDFQYIDLDALEPTILKESYFHSGDMIIQSPWNVTEGESYVIFIDGDQYIEDPLSIGELITVEEGGFLAFIVSGDINIADSIGHSTLTNTSGNIEGVYIADGTITIMSNGSTDKRFIGEGTFVGWTDVEMLRDFGDEMNNQQFPTETFVYRPDFVRYTPEKMKRPQMIWQETN